MSDTQPADNAPDTSYNRDSGHNRDGGNNRRRRRRGRSRRPHHDQGDVPSKPLQVELKVPEDQTIIIGLTGEPGCRQKRSSRRNSLNWAPPALMLISLGHEVIEGPATKKKLIDTFGEDIVGEDGKIERAKLAAKAFADGEQTEKLNKIVHPRLTTKVKTTLKKAGNFVVIDAALLSELSLGELCNQTVYIKAPVETVYTGSLNAAGTLKS